MDEFITFSEKIKQSIKSHIDLLEKNIITNFGNYIKDMKKNFKDDLIDI